MQPQRRVWDASESCPWQALEAAERGEPKRAPSISPRPLSETFSRALSFSIAVGSTAGYFVPNDLSCIYLSRNVFHSPGENKDLEARYLRDLPVSTSRHAHEIDWTIIKFIRGFNSIFYEHETHRRKSRRIPVIIDVLKSHILRGIFILTALFHCKIYVGNLCRKKKLH